MTSAFGGQRSIQLSYGRAGFWFAIEARRTILEGEEGDKYMSNLGSGCHAASKLVSEPAALGD